MDLDLDPFDDIVAEPTARAGGKFQPKARPQPKMGKHAPIATKLTTATKDIPAAAATAPEDNSDTDSLTQMPEINITKISYPGKHAPIATKLTAATKDIPAAAATAPEDNSDTVSLTQMPEINITKISYPGNVMSDGDSSSALIDISCQPLRDKEFLEHENALHSELPISSIDGDLRLDFATSERESADILFNFNDIVPESTTATVMSTVRKLQPRVKAKAQTTTTGGLQSAVETEYNDEYAYPAPSVDNYVDPGYYSDDYMDPVSADNASVNQSTVNVSLPAMPNHASEFTMNECLTNHEDASKSNSATPQEAVESQAVFPISGKEVKKTRTRRKKVGFALDDKRTKTHSERAEEIPQESPGEGNLLASDMKNESGKSSRLLRKRPNRPVHTDKTKGGTKKGANMSIELSARSSEDEDGHSDGGDKNSEDASQRKRRAKKPELTVQNEKPGRKRKRTSEEQDSSSKEPTKKFSHTTRRNKRKLSKALLETPEEEIDPRKLPIKDLILLAELREESLKKDSTASKKSLPTQSVDNSFYMDAPYDAPYGDDDDPFASMGVDREFQETEHRKINYHSFMKKTARIKWSKQDTELFYEGIRQFGTDFTMIQQLFPDLDPDDGRRQLVLKYKNEERRNPMRLHEAVTNRSKNHSHFEQVIEKLKKLEEDQNYDRDVESGDMSGEEADHNAPDTNDTAESYQKDVCDDTDTTEIHEADDPAQSVPQAEDNNDGKYDDYNDYDYDYDYDNGYAG